MKNLISHIKYLLDEPPGYLEKKYDEYRLPSGIIFAILLSAGVLLWSWDWVVDPVHAPETFLLRLVFLLGLILVPVFIFFKNKIILIATYLVSALLVGEAVLLLIFEKLDNGIAYGTGGFLFFIFLAPLVLRCFSFMENLVLTIITAIFPHLFALLAGIEGFRHMYYAVFIGPGAFTAILVQIILAQSDRRNYEKEARLEMMSHTDPLTGAANRRFFMSLVDQEIHRSSRSGEKTSLMMLDIDFFKQVNDKYGHPAGDEVLCRFSEICKNSVRNIDTVARLGGEEFAILLPGTDMEGARVSAERIRKAVENFSFHDSHGNEFNITVSIGIAFSSQKSTTSENLINTADKALYRAKAGGRNRIF